MKKSNTYTYNKNIVLDVERMDSLQTILQKYCEKLSYEARTEENADIKFDSFDELMGYSNFKKGRIKRLEIIGYPTQNSWDRNISITFSSEKFNGESFVCQYNFSDESQELIFKNEIHTLLEKSTSGYIKSRIGDIVVYVLILLLLLWLTKLLAPEHALICAALAGALSSFFLSLFNNSIWKTLFPMVSFSWGEAVSYYSSIEKRKEKVFWGIMITILLSIVANYIFKILFPS